MTRSQAALLAQARRLQFATRIQLQQQGQELQRLAQELPQRLQRSLERQRERLARSALRLQLLDPNLVLQRGYAWVSDQQGRTVRSSQDLDLGQNLRLHLAQGQAGVSVNDLKPA